MAANTSIRTRASWAACGMMAVFFVLAGVAIHFLHPELTAALMADHTSLLLLMGTLLCGFFFCWLLLFFLFGRFLTPVTKLHQMAKQMARGELTAGQATGNREDETTELGELAELGDCLRKTCRLLKAYVEDIDHTLGRMARGDFTVKVAADYEGDFAPIKTSLNSISDGLHSVFTLIDDAARRTMGGSYQVSGASGRLSAGVASQTHSADALAESLEELRRQISESAGYANRASRASREVDEELQNLRGLGDQICRALDESRAAATELLQLVNSIDNTSRQMGMLSINASAEAVRAGEKAYGFAVVADEIREFSGKSSVAAQQAAELATRIRDAGERGRQMAAVTNQSIHTLAEKSRAAASSVGLIAATSAVQSQAVNRVRKDVSGISAVVHSNAQVAEQCSASSVELTQQAQALAKVLSAFYTKDSASNRVSASSRISARQEDFIFHDFS